MGKIKNRIIIRLELAPIKSLGNKILHEDYYIEIDDRKIAQKFWTELKSYVCLYDKLNKKFEDIINKEG